jgi:uncharacterized protein
MLPFDEAAQQRLIDLTEDKAAEGSTMRADEIQAFMLALLSGPDEVPTHIWLPEVLGDQSDAFSEQEVQEIQDLVLRLTADLRQSLEAGELPDLLLYEEEDELPDFYTWCNAYLYALDVVETDWFEAVDDENFEDLFYPVMALGGVYDAHEGGEAVLNLTDKELTLLEGELPHVLLDIYRYWQAIIHKPQTVRREGEKTGRNDPCPCGSGKKYKACCGKTA